MAEVLCVYQTIRAGGRQQEESWESERIDLGAVMRFSDFRPGKCLDFSLAISSSLDF